MKIKVSEYIVNFLSKQGIRDVFTITGGGAMHLNDAFAKNQHIKCTYNHHEQACSIAAEGYFRYSNRLPAVCVTSGPGGTNALTGVLGAWLDSIPMFIISGQVKRETTVWSSNLPLRQLGDQEHNIIETVKPMTKYAVMITDENEISYHLEKAIYLCKNGRPGPVWIDVPLDIQGMMIETDNLKHYSTQQNECLSFSINNDEIQKIINKITMSKRPVILAGKGIQLSNCRDNFIKLIEKLKIPVVTAWTAKDLLHNDHELYAGRPGLMATRGGNFVVQNCDLLISLGCRLSIKQISYNWQSFAKNAYKIMVDIDKSELEKPTLKINMPIHNDVKNIIQALIDYPYINNNDEHTKWLQWCKDINIKYPVIQSKFYDVQSPINPYVFIHKLSKNLSENDVIVTSVGTGYIVALQAFLLKKGQRFISNSGCATMGYGLPAAIGVSVYDKKKPVICLEGDGGIQMNLQELQTIVHNNLNIKIFWLNNCGYHSIRQTQKNLFNPPYYGISSDNGVSFPQAEKIATAYGINYTKADKIDDLDKTINTVINSEGSYICEIILDIEQNFEPKMSSKVLENGEMTSPPLEDMFPFLPKKELDNIMLPSTEV